MPGSQGHEPAEGVRPLHIQLVEDGLAQHGPSRARQRERHIIRPLRHALPRAGAARQRITGSAVALAGLGAAAATAAAAAAAASAAAAAVIAAVAAAAEPAAAAVEPGGAAGSAVAVAVDVLVGLQGCESARLLQPVPVSGALCLTIRLRVRACPARALPGVRAA